MSEWAPKRFWETTSVFEQDGKFGVRLDSRELRTPLKASLLVPTHDLAVDVASEWDAQDEVVNPESMPYTRTTNSAIDTVEAKRADIEAMLSAYAETDLLCYRADGPQALIERQTEQWNPLLKWCEETFGASLNVVAGVMPVDQDRDAVSALSARIQGFSAFELAALYDLITLPGSIVIGLAVAHRYASAETLWEVSRLDELWQIEQWGPDEEANRVAEIKRLSFLHAADFLEKSRA